MKTMCKNLLAFILIIYSSVAFGQVTPRTKAVFENAPTTIQLDIPLLEKSFSYKSGSYANLNFHPTFRFAGRVISNLQKYENLQSITIESNQYDNAILLLSRQINPDKTISYTGRIMHPNSTDGFEIKKDLKGNYILSKLNTKTILQQCL